MNRAYSLLHVKKVDDDKRIITGIATTPSVDRMGDIVEPKGAEFKLPIPLLWQHNSAQPIGFVTRARVTNAGIEITAKIEREDEPGELKTLLDFAWQSMKKGLVRGLSIGFQPLERSRIEGDTYGQRFIKWLWLELSAVTIPANQEASITTIKTFDDEARAASGRMRQASKTAPVVSGHFSGNSQTKGTRKMKTTEMLIRELEEQRSVKAARMEEIAPDEDGGFEDDEAKKEYRALVKDVKELDEKISDQEGILLARKTARPVIAKNAREAGKSRAGDVVVKELPKGTAFTRYVMAMAATKGAAGEAMEFAKRWDGQTPEVGEYIRRMHFGTKAQDVGTIGGDATESPDSWGSHLGYKPNLAAEFVELLYPATLIGRMEGFRRIPFNVRVGVQDGGSTVAWVGEAAAKPVTGLNFDEVTFTYSKIAGIIVLTDELVRLSTPSAEAVVRNDLVRSIAKFMDEQLLDTSITASSSRPASLTASGTGFTAIAASGYDADAFYMDVNDALAGYDNAETGLENIYVLTTPAVARGLSTMRNALGNFEFAPGLNPQGGMLMGFKVLVSNSVPDNYILFVKTDEIWLADDGQVTIDASREATVDMSGGSSPAFSFWQKNCVGIRAERWIRWQKRRTSAVQGISGALYNPTGTSPV